VTPGRDIGHGARELPPMRMVKREPMMAPDYRGLEKPTFQRQRAVGDGLRAEPAAAEELLDIPAFLRRQAD